jgi:uncharacterized protein YwqG
VRLRQAADYADRKGMTVAEVERWLGPNLNYEPDKYEPFICGVRDSVSPAIEPSGNILGPMNREQAIELIRDPALSEYAETLVSYLSPSARITVHDAPAGGSDRSTASHFGGLPSLPENAAWPDWDKTAYLKAAIETLEKQIEARARRSQDEHEKVPGLRQKFLSLTQNRLAKMREELSWGRVPLAFLGQLSLSEVTAAAPLPGWPREGTLAFFYDASWLWGFSPLHRGHCRVLYFPASVALIPTEFPQKLAAGARFPEQPVTFECEWTLPTYLKLNDGAVNLWKMDEYRELIEKLNSDGANQKDQVHRCGGYPQEIQGDMRLECQLVTNGIDCGRPAGYRDPRRAELENGAADWRLLVQFDSDEDRLRWIWGDVGRVYFWARQKGIEAADFSNSWAILQCY